MIGRRRQPLALPPRPFRIINDLPRRRRMDTGEGADAAVERCVRQRQFEIDAVVADDLVEPVDAALAVLRVFVAQPLISNPPALSNYRFQPTALTGLG